MGTTCRALTPHTIAVDTCSGYNVIAPSALPPDWQDYLVDTNEALPRLANADSSPLQLSGVVSLVVRFANNRYRLPFVIADSLAVDVLVGTPFIDTHVSNFDIERRRINFRIGGHVPILSPPDVTPSAGNQADTPSHPRRLPGPNVHPIYLSRPITIPPMSQLAARVSSSAVGLFQIKPKPSALFRHGVRATNGVHDFSPNMPFSLLLANFSAFPRCLPKGMVIAFAERNIDPIFTPHRGRVQTHTEHIDNCTDTSS